MDFEFPETVEKIEKVPEQFRGFYQQNGESFGLVEGFKGAATAVLGLNKSLKAARKDADEARRSRPNVDGFKAVGQLLGLEGDDQASADALKGAVEKIISESKDGKVNWDKLRKDLERGHATAIAGKDAEIQTMSKSLQKYLVTTAAVQAIAGEKGVPELLLPHIQAKTKVVKEGEDYVVRVVDDSGDPRGNASGGFMTVADLVKEMKASPTFGRAFESEAPAGSGVKPGQGGTKPNARPTGNLSPTQKIAAGLAKRR